MNTIVQYLAAPSFWICTVIGSMVLSVVSHFVIKWLDSTSTHISKKRATRNKTLQAERNARIEIYASHYVEQQINTSLAIHTQLNGLFYCVIGCFICLSEFILNFNLEDVDFTTHGTLATAMIIFVVGGIMLGWIMFMRGVRQFIQAQECVNEIAEARKIEKEKKSG